MVLTLNVCQTSAVKPYTPGLLFAGKILITDLILFIIRSVQIFCCLTIQFWVVCVSRDLLFLLGYSFCWRTIENSLTILFFCFCSIVFICSLFSDCSYNLSSYSKHLFIRSFQSTTSSFCWFFPLVFLSCLSIIFVISFLLLDLGLVILFLVSGSENIGCWFVMFLLF